MEWGLTFKDVYLSRVHLAEVDCELEDVTRDINTIKDTLLVLAASTPRDVKDEEGVIEAWEEKIVREVNYALEELSDLMVKRYLLRLAQECPESVDEC